MTVGELQRRRGVQAPDNPHADILEAYGYRQLAELVMNIPSMGLRALDAVGRAMSFRIGPPGTDAAPAGRGHAPSVPAMSVRDFVKKHSDDFQIWISPSASKASDMRGAIIVMGEHHYDPNIQDVIEKAMSDFRNLRPLNLFFEGGEEGMCELSMFQFGFSRQPCRLLEEGFPDFQKMRDAMVDSTEKMGIVAAFIRRHVPAASVESLEFDDPDMLLEFIKRHERALPAKVITEYKRIAAEAKKTYENVNVMIQSLSPKRDQWMSDKLRQERSLTVPNVALVGAAHLRPMLSRLMDLPCVFMNPKSLARSYPETSLADLHKEEL